MDFLILIIGVFFQLLFWLVIIAVVLSYFMAPYHPVRQRIDSLVEPMLAPIRRILPPMGGLDFSPFVLLILIQVFRNIIIRLLLTLR
ncbi:MAG TPA: YggT family protein [Anaerolineales bacterium]|jgi:YggT family protein|nr:YggT family protein [Anaerolineales bacterium]